MSRAPEINIDVAAAGMEAAPQTKASWTAGAKLWYDCQCRMLGNITPTIYVSASV